MDDEQRYHRWQEIYAEFIAENEGNFDFRPIYEHSLPAFIRTNLIELKASDSLELGLSRLEWLPDLPRGLAWPEHEGRALDFVAQVNLADLEAGFHPSLPERGWLYFFVGDFWGENIIHHRVLYFDGPVSELVRVTPPPGLRPPDQLSQETALIGFEPGFIIEPGFHDRLNETSWASRDQTEAERQMIAPPYELCQPEISRLGGYAYGFQGGGVDQEARRYLNGFENLIKFGYFQGLPWFTSHEARDRYLQEYEDKIVNAGKLEQFTQEVERYNQLKADFEQQTAPVEMLFGLESALDRCWGDAGFLEFFIRPDDLAKRNFDHTYCDILST